MALDRQSRCSLEVLGRDWILSQKSKRSWSLRQLLLSHSIQISLPLTHKHFKTMFLKTSHLYLFR